MDRVKTHKWKVIGVVAVLVVGIVLGFTLGGRGDDPSPPTPVPPQPVPPTPIPVDAGINPYFVKNGTLAYSKSICIG